MRRSDPGSLALLSATARAKKFDHMSGEFVMLDTPPPPCPAGCPLTSLSLSSVQIFFQSISVKRHHLDRQVLHLEQLASPRSVLKEGLFRHPKQVVTGQ